MKNKQKASKIMNYEQDWPASNIDLCVCVIFHISSWRYGRIVTFFWCINDDCNLCVCVILHLKRHACVIISLQYNFLYDLPTHSQAWKRKSRWRLANPYLFWSNLCVCDFASQETCMCDYLCVVQFFVWFTDSLAKHEEQADEGWLICVSFDVICLWFHIPCHNKGDAGLLVLVNST
jgi:hypothetical protein